MTVQKCSIIYAYKIFPVSKAFNGSLVYIILSLFLIINLCSIHTILIKSNKNLIQFMYISGSGNETGIIKVSNDHK